MILIRFATAFVAASGLVCSTALAGLLGAGVGAGGHGNAGITVPAVGVPPVQAPPVQAPPVRVPPVQAPVGGSVNASAHANAHGAVTMGTIGSGTVTALSGNTATLRLSGGATQTYSVSSQTASRLRAFVNKRIAFRAQNGMLALQGVGTPPLRGTLMWVNATTAQIKLANGQMQNVALTAAQATRLRTRVGHNVAFWANADGTISFNESGR